MIDPTLIFFAALAAFLCYRLYTVRGTRGGHEPDEADRLRPGSPPEASGPADETDLRPADPAPSSLPEWAETLRLEDDPDFDPGHFVTGAKAAYEMIVQAFAKGELRDVEAYIDPQVRQAFATAVSAREGAGQSLEVTFVGIESADVDLAASDGGRTHVVVAFQSDQIRVVRNAEGEVVDGDPNRIDLVKDRWTFSRETGSRDPNWILTATDGAAPVAG